MHSMMSLAQVVGWLVGAQLVGDASVRVNRVHTDTRTIEPGDLFVALKGERYDANAFLLERTRFVGKQALSLLMLAPLVVPGVILGISILALASRVAITYRTAPLWARAENTTRLLDTSNCTYGLL